MATVITQKTVHIRRQLGAVARSMAAIKTMPASAAPLIFAAGMILYMINLREAHFREMVQLVSGWVCVLLLFAIGRFPATRRNAWRLVWSRLANAATWNWSHH